MGGPWCIKLFFFVVNIDYPNKTCHIKSKVQWLGDVAKLVQCLPRVSQILDLIPMWNRMPVIPASGKMKAGGSEV